MPPPESNEPVFIVGPTASDKSAAAMEVAQKFWGSRIICLDKCTAWEEMDIGTAKPSAADRSKVVHELLDIFHMGYSAWHWPPGFDYLNDKFGSYPDNITAIMVNEAQKRLDTSKHIGSLALCVGGSMSLYSALYDGHVYPTVRPRSDPKLRQLSYMEVADMSDYLMQQGITAPFTPNDILGEEELDPGILFEQIVEAETRSATGKNLRGALVVGIEVDDETLVKRIHRRTDQMVEQGLESEVEDLVGRYGWVLPLRGTVGYKEWRGRLPGRLDNFSLNDAVANINSSTLRYARRQQTWLRQRKEVRWVRSPKEAADVALASLARHASGTH